MRRSSTALNASQLLRMARLLSSAWPLQLPGGCTARCRWLSAHPGQQGPTATGPPSLAQPSNLRAGRNAVVVAAAGAAGKGHRGPAGPSPERPARPAHQQQQPLPPAPQQAQQQQQQQQQQPSHQQHQQHQDYHTVTSSWQVPRTAIEHYPPATQQRMRSEWRGRGAGGSSGSGMNGRRVPAPPAQQQGAHGAAPAAAAAAAPPPEATAAVEQLLAALNWETSTGHTNGMGRSGLRFSDWAAGRLLELAASLPPACPQPEVQQQQQQQPGPSTAAAAAASGPRSQLPSSSELAAHCAGLASELGAYGSLDAAGRAELTQRTRLAAEGLLHQALLTCRRQGWGGRAGAHGSGGTPAAPAPVQVPVQAMPGPPPAPPQQQQQQQQQQQKQRAAGPAAALQAPSAEAQALAADEDAVAALAHEEETANGSGTMLVPGSESPEGAASSSEGEREGSAPSGSDAEAGGRARRRRVVGAETLRFRQSFAAAAAALSEAAGEPGVSSVVAGGEQRTAEWHRLRERRLTASAFSKALGFFAGDREGLWEEKVGLRAPFAGNAATAWGTRSETIALDAYQRNTGQAIEGCMFHVKHDDMAHGWLGASPDGLIGGLQVAPAGRGAGRLAGQGPGILEVKCPFNKGRPEAAVPPQHAIWYYMPQVQGLMDIFDRDWCNLYIWTPAGGSGLYHIPRDRRYWAECYAVLAQFWWSHVVPARQARERHGAHAPPSLLDQYRPQEASEATGRLKAWSKELAAAAPATFFPPLPPGA